jgi:hypothetical protein
MSWVVKPMALLLKKRAPGQQMWGHSLCHAKLSL